MCYSNPIGGRSFQRPLGPNVSCTNCAVCCHTFSLVGRKDVLLARFFVPLFCLVTGNIFMGSLLWRRIQANDAAHIVQAEFACNMLLGFCTWTIHIEGPEISNDIPHILHLKFVLGCQCLGSELRGVSVSICQELHRLTEGDASCRHYFRLVVSILVLLP